MRIPDPIGATSVNTMEHGVISAEVRVVVCAREALDGNALARSRPDRIEAA
ncbi:hypothetical protein [Allosphingosinicella deserti]|uniref:hypothetical protein n=1 Tax=Allosphingosinicella deserti TaxID=2116704 RepID=UPI001304CAEC|nr:hypothetical protein [Sphingomonas deserti]